MAEHCGCLTASSPSSNTLSSPVRTSEGRMKMVIAFHASDAGSNPAGHARERAGLVGLSLESTPQPIRRLCPLSLPHLSPRKTNPSHAILLRAACTPSPSRLEHDTIQYGDLGSMAEHALKIRHARTCHGENRGRSEMVILRERGAQVRILQVARNESGPEHMGYLFIRTPHLRKFVQSRITAVFHAVRYEAHVGAAASRWP